MATKLQCLLVGALLGLTTFLSASEHLDDPSGLWKWTVPARNGTPERLFNLRLKTDGDKLTGSILTPNRTNGTFSESVLRNGIVTNEQIFFEVQRAGRNATNIFISKYAGKVLGDKIIGTIETSSRGGRVQTNDWQAERNLTGQLVAGERVVLRPGYDEYGRKIVNETHFKEISVAEAEKFLSEHPDAVILDTRSPEEFAEGHLPKAQNYNLTDEATYKQVLAPLDKSKWYVVHSAAGHYRTVRALEFFEANGFEHAVAIDGGYNAWVDAGKPTVK